MVPAAAVSLTCRSIFAASFRPWLTVWPEETEGVLPVCVGKYTRLVDFVSEGEKGYYAELRLGVRTSTDDAEGEVVEERPVPALRFEDIEGALGLFRGTISQVPPAYSAVKVAGQRAYDLARRGAAPVLAAREVTVHRLDVLRWEPPSMALLVACSKGTYVRSIVRDLGEALGCGAHLTRLVRLWVGSFGLSEAVSLEELQEAASTGRVQAVLLPAEVALRSLPSAIVDPRRIVDLSHGRAWPASPDVRVERLARVYDSDGRLLGLAEHDAGRRVWQPRLALTPPAGDPNPEH